MSTIRTPPHDLAQTLVSLASGVRHGRIRGHELARLEGAINTTAVCVQRNAAVRRLAELIGGELEPPWRVAGKVASALDHFEASEAWAEIRTGRRAARSTFEASAEVVLSCPGGRTQRRIYEALKGR